MRPQRRVRAPSAIVTPAGAAIQVFISRVDAFLGTELFGADMPVTIGRHRNCSIRLDEDTISRNHCQLRLEGLNVVLDDVESGNGTLVNHRRVEGQVELTPTDSIQIGPYTLKVRPLIPRAVTAARPQSGISEKTTRLKANLFAEGRNGTEEQAIDLGHGIDWKLYEAAVRRATGAESASPIPFVVVPGGRPDTATARAKHLPSPPPPNETIEREMTRRASGVVEVVAGLRERPTRHGVELDPRIDMRIEELDRMMSRLEREDDGRPRHDTVQSKARNPIRALEEDVFEQIESSPAIAQLTPDLAGMTANDFASYLALELSRATGPAETSAERPSAIRSVVSRDFSVVPSDDMRDLSDSEEDTLSEELEVPVSAAPIVAPEPVRAIAKAKRPRPATIARPRINASRAKPIEQLPMVRARRVAAGSSVEVPPAIIVPPPLPNTEAVMANPPTPKPVLRIDTPPPREPMCEPTTGPTREVPRPPPLPQMRAPRRETTHARPRQPMAEQEAVPSTERAHDRVETPVRRTPPPLPPRVERPEVPSMRERVATRARRVEATNAARRAEPSRVVRRASPLPLPLAAMTPNGATGEFQGPRIRTPIPAALVTPTGMRVAVSPIDPDSRALYGDGARRTPAPTVSYNPGESGDLFIEDDEEFTEALEDFQPQEAPFAAVEISARYDGRLLDIATLRHQGDQYVLGHKTPQGNRAPHVAHTGLRLLRISDGRLVDLVFPGDAAGHLVRDRETVMFTELAQGRKYSCLRLSSTDVATIILRGTEKQISYHIRFVRSPRL